MNISAASPGFNASPKRGDRVHVAVAVVPAVDVGEADRVARINDFLCFTRRESMTDKFVCISRCLIS